MSRHKGGKQSCYIGKFLDSESILGAEMAQYMGEIPNQQALRRKVN